MEPSPAKAKPQGRLLVSTALDSKDELEERLERCVQIVQSLTNGLSEREANDALTANVCKGQQQHEEVCLGLFTLILTEPAQAQRTVWLVRELVKTAVIGADGVLMTLLKQIRFVVHVCFRRDISSKNLWLAESALDILLDQKLIVDHGASNLLLLRQKEVDFCVQMLREKSEFIDCMVIGRDLVRLLQNVARIPEMDYSGEICILQLLTARTSRKFLACRLTPDMETKLLFMTSSRHPSNEVLSSDILPRWAIIEPAILVMHHSMKPHPAITATLLDFMCRIIPHFFPPLESQVRQGVLNSLTFIMEKRVLAHLAPLFDNPKLDRELRAMLRDRFPEFCSAPSPPTEVKLEDSSLLDSHLLDKDEACYDNTEAAFSDDEEELSTKGKKREFRFHPIREAVVEEPADITPWLDQLEDSMKDKVQQLQKTSDTETQCEVMQEIVDQVLEDDFDQEQMSSLACCLSELFKEHFRGRRFTRRDHRRISRRVGGKPVCLIFRNLVLMQEDNSGFSVLLDLLAELYQKQPKIGYHLLYYLKASKAANGKMLLYESFAQATALGDLHTCLMMDMKACQEDDVRLLCFLTPSIYTEFPDETLRSGELLNMIVAVIDSTQEMVKMVLSRPCHPEDHFTTSLLRHWATRHDDTLGEHIKAQLIKNNSQPRKRQSLRSSSSKLAQLTLEQILEHLDNLRLSLSNVKNNCLSFIKASSAVITSPRQRKGATEEESASSSALTLTFYSDSEEEDSKPKAPKRKRKGSSAVGSDSD
ncbi:hypothetical protein WMY93_004374 [Mugilogobius chulae]|uniref:Uncharacterized protein n=1 Tax=Mugilogobius chulae TaxID=88201 RepID=A0AAW0PZP2_9GOBI